MALAIIKGEMIPIKAIPEAELNAKILNELTPWLTQLLSIKATEENVERLEVLLPMVKDNCWSMPISEIKKAFTMYVQGLLPIEPRDNYLTAILFSKVVHAYKQQKPVKKAAPIQIEMNADDSREIAIENILQAYDKWKESGDVYNEYAPAFDRLLEWGIIKDGDAYDNYYGGKLIQAGGIVNAEIIDLWSYKKRCGYDEKKANREMSKARAAVNSVGVKHPRIQKKFRCLVLQDLFKKLTREQLKTKIDGIS